MYPYQSPLRGSSPSRYTYSVTRSHISPFTEVIMTSPLVPECSKEVCEAVMNIFKTIALEESDIERLRQVFSHMREFTSNQKALFAVFDLDKSGEVSGEELLKFLQANLVKTATLAVCNQIIAEFDSD